MIDKPQMWWTIIVLLWIPSAHAQAFCALSDKTFCLYSEERGSQIALRLHAYKSVGWISVGFGTSMANADVYVAWKGTDGKVSLSRRQSKGTVMPTMVSQSFITNGTFVKGNEWHVTFLRQKTLPSNATGVKPSITSSRQSIIWAIGTSPPSGNAASSSFSAHPMTNGYGIEQVQLFATLSRFSGSLGTPQISGTTSKDKFGPILIHGILMFVAWGVCAPAGILIARYFKNEMGVWWFRAHIAFMGGLVGGLSIAGFSVMVKEIPDRHFDMTKYKSPFGVHVLIGLIIFIILFLQIAQGVIIDRLWNPQRRSIPWWDKLHWWMGRIIFLLSLANIPVGMMLMIAMSYTVSNVIFGMVALWSLLVLLAFAGLEAFKGQTHHKEPSPTRANLRDSPFYPDYMSESKYYA